MNNVKCFKCGGDCRVGTEQVGVGPNGMPIIHRFSYCDRCMIKNDMDIPPVPQMGPVTQVPNSVKKGGLPKGWPILAVGVVIFLLVVGAIFGGNKNSKDSSNENGKEKTTEAAETKVIDNRDKGDSKENDMKNESTAKEEAVTTSDEEFEKKGYTYKNILNDTLYFYTVKNNSKAVVSIEGNAVAYDSEGNELGASQRDIDVLGQGETSLMVFYFEDVEEFDHIDCKLDYKTSTFYKPVISNISMEQSINDSNLTIVAKNTGEYNAQFVEAYALFFDENDNVLSYSSTYITDGDSEIKPGASRSVQLDCYKGFDHVECYLTGRSTGKTTEVKSDVSESDFAVEEYIYEDSIGCSHSYLVITNNSSKTVGIDVNMTAYDKDNGVIGAGSGSIDVIAPGEQSIATVFFDFVQAIDHTEYSLSFDTSPYYESGLADLEIEEHVNDKNVVVTVTNNGSKATKFLQGYALFFDASGNVVDSDSTYIVDGDSELKPGATLSQQLSSYKGFDTVKVFFTARRGGF